MLHTEVSLPQLARKSHLHLLDPGLCLSQVGLEELLLTVAVEGLGSLILLDDSVIILLGQVGPDVGREVEQELESVQNHQGISRLVGLVLPPQNVEEHFVGFVLAARDGLLYTGGGILAVLSVVNLVALLDRPQSVQLVHDTVHVGLDEGQLILVVARDLPSQMF